MSSLRSKIDDGQPERDAKHAAERRAREIALRASLHKLEGQPGGSADVATIQADAMVKAATDAEARAAENLTQEEQDLANMPVTVRQSIEKPWMRNGRQWRPMTTRELSAEQDERMDRKALEDLAAYQVLVQKDIDLSEGYERQRQQRESRERRTGLRPLPSSKDRTISLAQAKAEGYICTGQDDE